MTVRRSSASQAIVDKLITSYIIDSLCPLCTVEKFSVITLVEGLCTNEQIKVMTRKTLSNRINDHYENVIFSLKNFLQAVVHVCTTADIWSVNNRSYLGLTVHRISVDITRHSSALACKRFIGSHTYDRMAELMSDIYSQFEISTKKLLLLQLIMPGIL